MQQKVPPSNVVELLERIAALEADNAELRARLVPRDHQPGDDEPSGSAREAAEREELVQLGPDAGLLATGARLGAGAYDITAGEHAGEARPEPQKLEALGTLAGGIAHEFNDILQAIRGNTMLAIGDLGPGHPALESLLEIDKASQRATDLVRQMLSFSRREDPERSVLEAVEAESAEPPPASRPASSGNLELDPPLRSKRSE